MITLWRIFIASWKNVARNAWLSLATVFVFTLALLSVNVLLGADALIGSAIRLLEDKVDVAVSFKPETPEAIVKQARFYLTSLPQVASASVISPEQVLATFKARHARDPKVLSALDELPQNPFGAQIVIKAKHADDYPLLMQEVQNPQYGSFVESKTFDDHEVAIARVRDLSRNVRITGAVLVAIFALFGLLIVFNAIRVAIYTQREEIAIMWLVGASSSFIRAPFILSGLWLAFLGMALTGAALIPAIIWIEPIIRPLFDGADPGLASFFLSHAPQILLMEAGSMVVLVMLMSWLAVGKYLKK